eukprot:SAG11_NODE_11735_length_741_cov_1.040498_1_plen_92_part_00
MCTLFLSAGLRNEFGGAEVRTHLVAQSTRRTARLDTVVSELLKINHPTIPNRAHSEKGSLESVVSTQEAWERAYKGFGCPNPENMFDGVKQ